MAIQITIPTPDFKALGRRLKSLKVRKRRSRKAKLLTTLVVLAVLGGSGWYIYQRTLTGPAVGTVMMTMAGAEPKPQVELEQFDGTNFSFVHPMNFVEQITKPQPNLTDIEHHTFLSTGMTGQYLTIIISKFTGSSLVDDSSYNMRAQNDKKYQKKVIVVKNEPVTVFTSNGAQQFEQSAFWQHSGKLLIMTMTGLSGDNQTAIDQFNAMVKSLTWR